MQPEIVPICSSEMPLGLINLDGVSEGHLQRMRRLESTSISYVHDRLAGTPKMRAVSIAMAELELKRFFSLALLGHDPLAMISPVIDEMWHQFVLFTREYRTMCVDVLGFFLDHTPDTVFTPVPATAGQVFIDAYEYRYGRLPPIWFQGMNARLKRYYNHRPLVGKPPERWSGWVRPEGLDISGVANSSLTS